MVAKKPTKKNNGHRGVKYGVRKHQETDVTHANQWQGTPQQEKWLLFYLDPKSPTFANPYTSALESGYSEYYARVIAAPSTNRLWVQQARNLVKMLPEHIVQGVQNEATSSDNRSADRLKAYELLAKFSGMMIDRSVNVNVNIEEALNDLR